MRKIELHDKYPPHDSRNDAAVSPVVGIMLMLVVVIIIAAVVSGFSGSLVKSSEKAPELVMTVKITNNGHWQGSSFSARVTGVDKAIPTSDLKIQTQWTAKKSDGTTVSGGAKVIPLVNNTFVHFSPSSNAGTEADYYFVSPLGLGTGVGDSESTISGSGHTPSTRERFFGNYTLTVGTSMWAEPFGKSSAPQSGGFEGFDVGYGVITPFEYTYGQSQYVYYSHLSSRYKAGQSETLQERTDAQFFDGTHTDQMQAVLGHGWEALRAGDKVTVTILHIPTGKAIWQKDVIVEA